MEFWNFVGMLGWRNMEKYVNMEIRGLPLITGSDIIDIKQNSLVALLIMWCYFLLLIKLIV